MTRLARTLIDHCCYHIIARGNQKQIVFRNADDFLKYLQIVKKSKSKYAILLYSYCLMPNHVHLLIEVGMARNMSKFMHWINRGYTEYFNSKYQKVGHLWQGRFKSKPILKGQYLIHCSNYIENNPVRGGLAMDIANYEWNSYSERCFASRKNLLDEITVGTASILD